MSQLPIAYVAPDAYAFVKKDIEGLKARGNAVLPHFFETRSAWRLPLALLGQFVFLLRARRNGVRQVIAHFAGYHTVLPVLLGFRVHIIIAGADACSFPGIHYGSFRKPLMRAAMSYSMRRSATLLPVHESLQRFSNSFSGFGPVEQGFSHFVNGLATPIDPIPYGFDAAAWQVDRDRPDRAGALCVAMGAAPGNAIHFRKGIDLIMDAARAMPDVPFTVVGASNPASYTHVPSNVRIMGRVSQPELRDLYHAHAMYLQPSVMEGFPNALCEAMLCGCIPVVSGITSLPDIVGASGEVLESRNAELLLRALQRIEGLTPSEAQERRMEARDRVKAYSIERRMARLAAVMQD